jgi:hypothetical protein
MKKLSIAVCLFLLLQIRFASALGFHITYDSSVTTLTNAADFENAFATAAATFSDLFTNVATVNLSVYFTNQFGLGQSHFKLAAGGVNSGFTYAQITNALWTHRASAADTNAVATFPVTDPTGSQSWYVPYPEARILGLRTNNDGIEDGEISFSTNVSYTFDPNNRSVVGKFDFIGVAQHELSEILGRANAGLDGGLGFVPYDLFRFTNSGARSLTIAATTNAYFSLDNGATALRFFYTNHLAGDIQDWKTTNTPDSFDAFVTSGHINPISTVDITAMDVLGYNGLSLQPPHLYVTKSDSDVQLRFVNSPGVSFTILATTNIAMKETTWTALGTPTESPAGQFTFTDTTATNGLRFYSVRSP